MPRPCNCDRVVKGQPWQRGRDCARCWHWVHTLAYRAAHGDPGARRTMAQLAAHAAASPYDHVPAGRAAAAPCRGCLGKEDQPPEGQ